MNIRHFFFCATLILIALFTTSSGASELSGDQPWAHRFEIRLASHEKIEGWKRVPSSEQGEIVWISPEAVVTNDDVQLARLIRMADNKIFVDIEFSEEGALKFAHLTKSHIGEIVATMIDGTVTSVAKIKEEITNGCAILSGDFTYESARSIAQGIAVRQYPE